jgi:hypothetical protein
MLSQIARAGKVRTDPTPPQVRAQDHEALHIGLLTPTIPTCRRRQRFAVRLGLRGVTSSPSAWHGSAGCSNEGVGAAAGAIGAPAKKSKTTFCAIDKFQRNM